MLDNAPDQFRFMLMVLFVGVVFVGVVSLIRRYCCDVPLPDTDEWIRHNQPPSYDDIELVQNRLPQPSTADIDLPSYEEAIALIDSQVQL